MKKTSQQPKTAAVKLLSGNAIMAGSPDASFLDLYGGTGAAPSGGMQ